jgi:hypothetical protein
MFLNMFNLLMPTGYLTYHQVNHYKILRDVYVAFMCFVWLSEETVPFALYIINRLVFINKVESVYNAVRTGPLNKAVCACATYSIN